MACIDVALTEDLDLLSAPLVKGWLTAAIDANPGGTLRVDLADVTFLDSAGLGVLLGALRGMRETGGQVVLLHPSAAVTSVLTLTGLDRVFALEG